MILPQKQLYRIKKHLAENYRTGETCERFCDLAGMAVANLYLNGSAFENWGKVVDECFQRRDRALKLLDVICSENRTDILLENYRQEIRGNATVRRLKIFEAMQQGRCVVFLGPGVLRVRSQRGKEFNKLLCEELSAMMKFKMIYHDEQLSDNLSYLAQCYADKPFYAPGEMAEFAKEYYDEYKERFDNEVFEQLSMLPLQLVINSNPDNLLYEYLLQIQRNPLRSHYSSYSDSFDQDIASQQQQDPIVLPASPVTSRTLIYNIFGSFEDLDSVLFTESQFMDFIARVIQNDPGLDSTVMREFILRDTYLFLGFDFDQWYFKILFQLFKVKKMDYASVSCGIEQQAPAANAGIRIYNREFFEHEFKMFFIEDDISAFLRTLRNPIS